MVVVLGSRRKKKKNSQKIHLDWLMTCRVGKSLPVPTPPPFQRLAPFEMVCAGYLVVNEPAHIDSVRPYEEQERMEK